MRYHRISIVLPVYNQADHIAGIVREYEAALARVPLPHELLLVPNACRDNSAAVCRELAESFPAVRVIESELGGWGRAVKTGLRCAEGDLLCYTNSARTAAPDLVLLLLYAIAYPDTVIKANRRVRESLGRRLGSRLYNLECRALFGLTQGDINGTPKVFPRRFTALLQLCRDDDLIDAEFNVVCRRENYPLLEVPIFASRRHGGRSTTNLRSALRMYWNAFQMWRTLREAGR
jgi:glycosyltransferase involved in cell wall biosynthesis